MKKISLIVSGITLGIAVLLIGNVVVLNTVDAKSSPEKPTNLDVGVRSGDVYLYWNDNSNNESSFWVMRSQDDSGENWKRLAKVSRNKESYVDTSVQAGETYYYRVRAVTEEGGSKAWSNMVKISVGKDTNTFYSPTSLQARQNNTARNNKTIVDLTWKDNSAENSGYTIERSESGNSFNVRTRVGGNSLSYRDDDVYKGVQYRYRVRAYGTKNGKTVYSNYSNTTSVTVR